MTNDEKQRILVPARQHEKISVLAQRFGRRYDAIRQMLVRAEAAGVIPPGTMQKCHDKAPKIKPVVEESEPLIAYAPPRNVAAELGHCTVPGCRAPTSIVVSAATQERFCCTHVEKLRNQLEAGVRAAAQKRAVLRR